MDQRHRRLAGDRRRYRGERFPPRTAFEARSWCRMVLRGIARQSVRSCLAAPLVWIVDPIDGTRAYISGRADWTISVALAEHSRPKIAVLYAPVTDEMFLAVHGAGATLNGLPIHVSPGETLAGARLAGPKSYVDRLLRISPAIVPQPKVHSLALRIARVAQGSFEAALASGGSHDWDLAAAGLLVHEARGPLTDFAGQEAKYNEPRAAHGALVAAGRARHAAIIELVRDRRIEFASARPS